MPVISFVVEPDLTGEKGYVFMPKKGGARKKARKAVKTTRTTPKITGDDKALVADATKAEVSGSIWKPEVEGDTVTGEVLKIGKEKGKFGEQTVMILLTSGGAVTVFANEPMERGLEEHKVAAGDRIAIQFKGSVPSGKGRPCRLFAVAKRKGKAVRK